jgi:hypothetical protein
MHLLNLFVIRMNNGEDSQEEVVQKKKLEIITSTRIITVELGSQVVLFRSVVLVVGKKLMGCVQVGMCTYVPLS